MDKSKSWINQPWWISKSFTILWLTMVNHAPASCFLCQFKKKWSMLIDAPCGCGWRHLSNVGPFKSEEAVAWWKDTAHGVTKSAKDFAFNLFSKFEYSNVCLFPKFLWRIRLQKRHCVFLARWGTTATRWARRPVTTAPKARSDPVRGEFHVCMCSQPSGPLDLTNYNHSTKNKKHPALASRWNFRDFSSQWFCALLTLHIMLKQFDYTFSQHFSFAHRFIWRRLWLDILQGMPWRYLHASARCHSCRIVFGVPWPICIQFYIAWYWFIDFPNSGSEHIEHIEHIEPAHICISSTWIWSVLDPFCLGFPFSRI